MFDETFPDAASATAAAYSQFRAEAVQQMERDKSFRTQRIADFITFLKHAAAEYEFPWSQFEVSSNQQLCIQYTDESRGNALIKTITNLLIDNLLGNIDIAILFRDEQNPLFTQQSPATNKAFRVFKSAGGHFVPLKTEWLADFHAIAELRRRAIAGQITYPSEDGVEKAITLEDVRNFMSTGFRSGLLEVLAEIIHLTQLQDQADEAAVEAL